MSEADDVARIVDRLRRDHPDPAMRAQLYEGDKLVEYVRTLLPSDDATVARVATAVHAAEDGSTGPMT